MVEGAVVRRGKWDGTLRRIGVRVRVDVDVDVDGGVNVVIVGGQQSVKNDCHKLMRDARSSDALKLN